MSSINGFGTLLPQEHGYILEERGKGYPRRIVSSSHRMGQPIDDLLGLSRITRMEMRWKGLALSSLAGAMGEGIRQSHSGRRSELIVEKGPVVEGTGVC